MNSTQPYLSIVPDTVKVVSASSKAIIPLKKQSLDDMIERVKLCASPCAEKFVYEALPFHVPTMLFAAEAQSIVSSPSEHLYVELARIIKIRDDKSFTD